MKASIIVLVIALLLIMWFGLRAIDEQPSGPQALPWLQKVKP